MNLERELKIDRYKAEAVHLAQHLSNRHGLKLGRGEARDAIARMHGERDWSALTGELHEQEGFWNWVRSRVTPVLSQPANRQLKVRKDGIEGVDPGGYFLDVSPNAQILEWDALANHVLVTGSRHSGSAAFVESLLAQHVTKGGAFIVLRSVPDHEADQRLTALMKAASRRLYRYDPQYPETSHKYDVIGADDYSWRRFLELMGAFVLPFTTPTFDGGAVEAWRREHATFLDVIESLFVGLRLLGKPFSLSDIGELLASGQACTRLRDVLQAKHAFELPYSLTGSHWEAGNPRGWIAKEIKKFCTETPRGPLIDGYCHDFSLWSARTLEAGVVLSPSAHTRWATQGYRRMLVEDIHAHLQTAARDAEAGDTAPPLMVVIEDAAELGEEMLEKLRYTSHKANFSLVLMTEHLEPWRKYEATLPAAMLKYCQAHVLFRPSPGDVHFLRQWERDERRRAGLGDKTEYAGLETLEDGEALAKVYWSYRRVTAPQLMFDETPCELSVVEEPFLRREGRPLRVGNWIGHLAKDPDYS